MQQESGEKCELPLICGQELQPSSLRRLVFSPSSSIRFDKIKSACAVALHMHQPLVPAGSANLETAPLISNLDRMLSSEDSGERYNASVFLNCYRRMADIIPACLERGGSPRVMLDYSGTLLWGLQLLKQTEVLAALTYLANDPACRNCVEWLGSAWGHAVAPSTPPADFKLHVRAWQHHFASLFGQEALSRVRGFSPPEMALPNHPDVAFEFLRTLRESGFLWALVQEHTIEQAGTGDRISDPHMPHRLVCRNSQGEQLSIVVLIKTQCSDTKLVGQMQPWYEAVNSAPAGIAGRRIPPLVTQIADGENGGVMMNEFPSKYMEVVHLASGSETPLILGSEYLEHLFASGIQESDLPEAQPVHQQLIWNRVSPDCGPEKLAETIAELQRQRPQFHMEGGSWTSNMSWVRGYEQFISEMEKASSSFWKALSEDRISTHDQGYREALFYLLCSQTSCYRYWGAGVWTDYGNEICRRLRQISSP